MNSPLALEAEANVGYPVGNYFKLNSEREREERRERGRERERGEREREGKREERERGEREREEKPNHYILKKLAHKGHTS